jgi:hypothetical protein
MFLLRERKKLLMLLRERDYCVKKYFLLAKTECVMYELEALCRLFGLSDNFKRRSNQSLSSS